MGSTAIRSTVAFPGLELTGVITSSAAKSGRDAAEFAGLETPTGVAATTDVDAALAECDAVAYMASGDIRPEEAIADIERCLRAGALVVTPSLYSLYDPRSAPKEWVDRVPQVHEVNGRRMWTIDGLVFGIENKLRRVAISTSPHGLSPSFLKDAIVRQQSESRMPPKRLQT